MLWLLLFVPLIVASVWIYRCSRPLRRTPPAWLCYGLGERCERPVIPRIIWTYWHGPTLPLTVAACIAGWQRLHPGYLVKCLSPATVAEFIEDVPQHLAELPVTKQADWLRLALLHRYGGIWLDASIILTRPLDWALAAAEAAETDFVGFHIDRLNRLARFPVVENWFMAAAPDNKFVADWLRLFRTEVIDGGTDHYLATLDAAGLLASLSQRIADPHYHTMHVVAQQLLQSDKPLLPAYRLLLQRAEDSAFLLQDSVGWKRWRLYWRLLALSSDGAPPLIKLRGGERRKLEPYLRHGLYRQRSIVGQYLLPPPPAPQVRGPTNPPLAGAAS